MPARAAGAILGAMAAKAGASREELELLVAEYRHLRSEHRRAGPEGSARRHLRARLAELERAFERLLEEWVPAEAARQGWLAHLHHDAPAPDEPAPSLRPLVFRGRSAAGSVVEVRERPGGDLAVEVDGTLIERIEGRTDFGTAAPHIFRIGGLEFREAFQASGEAIVALSRFLTARRASPPFAHARELLDDGLVDRRFGLTTRGRRALARRQAGRP